MSKQHSQENGPQADVQNPEDEVREEISDQMQDKTEAADVAISAVDELADRSTEVETLRAELESAREQLLRKAAEFQNYRRRTEQEKVNLVAHSKGAVIQQLLDVVDDFERSLGAAQQVEEQGPAYDALKQGVEMVYRKLLDQLNKLGVEPIEAIGKPFDENEHEAMMQQPAPEGTEPGVVLNELQRGYRMGDRVLRHSKVVVAS